MLFNRNNVMLSIVWNALNSIRIIQTIALDVLKDIMLLQGRANVKNAPRSAKIVFNLILDIMIHKFGTLELSMNICLI